MIEGWTPAFCLFGCLIINNQVRSVFFDQKKLQSSLDSKQQLFTRQHFSLIASSYGIILVNYHNFELLFLNAKTGDEGGIVDEGGHSPYFISAERTEAK